MTIEKHSSHPIINDSSLLKVQFTIDSDGGTVDLSSKTAFTFIIREDTSYVLSMLNQRLPEIPKSNLIPVVQKAYEIYCQKLYDNLLLGLAPFRKAGEDIQVHIFNAEELRQAIEKKAGINPVISLDPLCPAKSPVLNYQTSRHYLLGGKVSIGSGNRPGSPSLAQQKIHIKQSLDGNQLAPIGVDDDIHSGGTAAKFAEALGFTNFIPGLFTGDPQAIAKLPIKIDPVVSYNVGHHAERVDLGDPRDFLLGIPGGGLAILLPSGTLGRLPYLLPCNSPNKRSCIHRTEEANFSIKMLKASLEFYQTVTVESGIELKLKNGDPHFRNAVHELFGFNHETKITEVIKFFINNFDSLVERINNFGKTSNLLHQSGYSFGQPFILLDVNGTLIEEDSGKIDFLNPRFDQIRQQISRLQEAGFSIGLCSDSPLPQLNILARQLGINGLNLAENGNIIGNEAFNFQLKGLQEIDQIKALLTKKISVAFPHAQDLEDIASPEFGGQINYRKHEWAFGLNRQSSIAIFAASEILVKIPRFLEEIRQEIGVPMSIDYSPDYNFIGVHGSDYKTSKGQSIRWLNEFTSSPIVMIGNSMSDHIDGCRPGGMIQCAFVGDARIEANATISASVIARSPNSKGVEEILSGIKSA